MGALLEEDEIQPQGDGAGRDENPHHVKDADKLLRYKGEIAQYVRTFTTECVPVKFEVDGRASPGNTAPDKTVTITAAISEENLPAVIGTALHEGAHINWTDLHFFEDLMEDPESLVPTRLWEKAVDQGEDEDWIRYAIKTITNVVEDRRIDDLTFEGRPGWRKYLLFRYNFWYFSEKINEQLQEAEDEMPEKWGAYMFHIANLHNPEVNLDALDALEDINDAMNMQNIDRLDNIRESFKVACDIFELVLDAVEEPMENFEKQPQACGDDGEQEMETVGIEGAGEEAEEDFNAQLDMIHGDEDKEELDEGTAQEIDLKENDDVEDVEVGGSHGDEANNTDGAGGDGMISGSGRIGRTDCRVIKRVTKDMISQSMFCLHRTSQYAPAVREGKNQGRLLAKRLKIRDEQREWTSTRKKRGKLSGALLAEIGFNENLFEQKHTEEYEDAFLHMSLDASGSMSGDKWEEAITCAMAIATACDIIGNVQCQISARFTSGSRGYRASAVKPAIAILYDSREESHREAESKLPHAAAGGSTPEGLCYEAVMEQILRSSAGKDAYFVNFSDGMPNFSNKNVNYGSSNAFRHTANQVRKMERFGDINVLSYYIGSGNGDEDFRKMYGNNSEFIDVTDIGSVARTLNSMLLEK